MIKSIKLYKGRKFKNYKELCGVMNWKYYNGGDSKKAQFKELDRLCRYKINPNKSIVILEVFEVKKDKIDNRGKQGNRRGRDKNMDYEKLKCDEKYDNCKGVYCIKLENYIYIGSTIAGFRKRFNQHYRYINDTQVVKIHHLDTTYNMINTNGAEFHILWIADDSSTEKEVRQMETNYIKQYCKDRNWIVVNKTKYAKWKGKNDNKYKTFLGFKIKYKDFKSFIDDVRNFINDELSEKYDIKNK